MSRPSLEIPSSRYYPSVHHDPPPISNSFDSRGESPLHHNSAPHESPYSSLNGALRPADTPLYPPSDFHTGDSLLNATVRQRRDHPHHPHSVQRPERSIHSRRGRSHSPYPVIGHMPEPSSSQRPDSRFRNPSTPGSYPHPQQQDLPAPSHYVGANSVNHLYMQHSYSPEMMPGPHTQPNYPPQEPDRFPQSRARQREPENVPTLAGRGFRNPTQPSQMNYRELMQHYSDIMSVAAQEPPVGGDLRNLGELMRNQALAGLRIFESAGEHNSPTSETRPGDSSFHRQQTGSASTSGPASPPQGRRGGRDMRGEGQVCKGCDATSTPEWRRGPLGPRTLCNACGLVYAKMLKRRSREANAAKAGAHKSQDMDSAEEGTSEFETTESPVSDPHEKR